MKIDLHRLPEGFSPAERAERARNLFLEGYNCCQAVVLAFEDIIEGADRESLAALTSGFGGGMGRMREVCGAVSGMVFLSGLISPATIPTDLQARGACYALVQKAAASFKEHTGSIVCREILGLRNCTKMESPSPSPRTEAYYHNRPCAGQCALAAETIAIRMAEYSAQ